MTGQEIMDICVDYEKTIRRYREALQEIAEMYTPGWKVGMTHETTQRLSTIAVTALDRHAEQGQKPCIARHDVMSNFFEGYCKFCDAPWSAEQGQKCPECGQDVGSGTPGCQMCSAENRQE